MPDSYRDLPLFNDDTVVSRVDLEGVTPGSVLLGGPEDPEGRYMVIEGHATSLRVVDLDVMVLLRWERLDDGWHAFRRGPSVAEVDEELVPEWDPVAVRLQPMPRWLVKPQQEA